MHNIRREYGKRALSRAELLKDPIAQFKAWFSEVEATQQRDPSAMVLATVDENNRPDSRIVLLKGIVDGCFIFYTDYNSCKGKQLTHCSCAALNFYWPEFSRQVRIRGQVEKVSATMSQHYFQSRPFKSQLTAIASAQSDVIADRDVLRESINKVLEKSQKGTLSCPDTWGGYQVKPFEIEFWQGRDNRLHDRFRYRWIKKRWHIERLAP